MSLDPDDWSNVRKLGHRMIDDLIDQLATIRDRPVWKKMPRDVREAFQESLPHTPQDPAAAYEDFRRRVLPYGVGNTHPGFMGWVHGGGNIIGVLAETLAAGLNANLGGREQAPVEVERQVIRWAAEMLGFPVDAGGLLVTGTSMANFIGVQVARTAALGRRSRGEGLNGARLVAYTSTAAHGCIARAMDMSGLGADALRLIPCDPDHRINHGALKDAVAKDKAAGVKPFLVVGTAGTVDVGATDDLAALAAFSRAEGLWFHVDAAFAALAALAPSLRSVLTGIAEADSVAFDFHKWAQVPYDAGCVLVRERARQLDTFSLSAPYLHRYPRGIAGGAPWPCDLGPDLSRGFRALKVWLTLKVYGADRIGQVIEESCAVAQILAARIDSESELERLAPVPLNIVCFRYVGDSGDLDNLNAEIVADIQEAGLAVPSVTTIDGKLAIRAGIFNHRTRSEDVHALVDAVLKYGRARALNTSI